MVNELDRFRNAISSVLSEYGVEDVKNIIENMDDGTICKFKNELGSAVFSGTSNALFSDFTINKKIEFLSGYSHDRESASLFIKPVNSPDNHTMEIRVKAIADNHDKTKPAGTTHINIKQANGVLVANIAIKGGRISLAHDRFSTDQQSITSSSAYAINILQPRVTDTFDLGDIEYSELKEISDTVRGGGYYGNVSGSNWYFKCARELAPSELTTIADSIEAGFSEGTNPEWSININVSAHELVKFLETI